jgi:hypothetical protein
VGFSNIHTPGPGLRLSPASARAIAEKGDVDPSRLEWGPDPDATPRDGVMLRFTGQGLMTADEFEEKLRRIRFRLGSAREAALVEQFAPGYTRRAIEERLDQLGGEFADAKEAGLTPVQAFLVTYSLTSDDLMHWATSDLKLQLAYGAASDGKAAKAGSPALQPFGRGGALFSTPLDMAFDRSGVERLLAVLEEGGRK